MKLLLAMIYLIPILVLVGLAALRGRDAIGELMSEDFSINHFAC